jgi:integrase
MAYNLGQFKTFLEESYRPGTVYEYLWRVRKFLDWLGGAPIKSVDQNTIVEYIRYLRQNGVRQTSTYAYALKCYFEFIGRNDLSGKVPVRRENVGKIPIWLPEPALKVLIAHIGDERMKVLATVMYDLALRVSEALMLNVGPLDSNIPWVDVQARLANVYRLKTKSYPFNVLPMSGWACKVVEGYIAKNGIGYGMPLFTTKPYMPWMKGGGRMSDGEASYLWRNVRKAFNLPEQFTLHCLRHSRLTWKAVEGETIIDISKFAGHASTSPTLIYTHLAQQFLSKPEVILEPFRQCTLYDRMLKGVMKWRDTYYMRQAY